MNKNELQGTDKWREDRRGKATASKFSLLMAARGIGKTGLDYALEIAADSIILTPDEIHMTHAMKDGIELEPYAIERYELETLNEVEKVGFMKSETNDFIGCSPDGLVGENGGVEIKCPQQTKHIQNLIATECPKEYYDQIQGTMYILNRSWWDFVSYNPTFVLEKQIKIIRVYPDVDWILKFESRLFDFLAKVEEYKLKLV
jgi:hypothetical protein